MQPEPSYTATEEDARQDWGVLTRLIRPDDQRPWSVAELIREVRSEVAARDSIGRLVRSGLIHLTSDGLVFPTRAALHYTEIRA
jgi:hypothetical protein